MQRILPNWQWKQFIGYTVNRHKYGGIRCKAVVQIHSKSYLQLWRLRLDLPLTQKFTKPINIRNETKQV
jgi:hypothetical protein